MAYDKKKLYEQALHLIDKKSCLFIEDVIALLPCAKSTFYEKFPAESDEMEAFKKRIEANRVEMKVSIRAKLYKGKNTAGHLALYKIIATEEERRALSQRYIDVETQGEKLEGHNIVVNLGAGTDPSNDDE